MPIIKSAKKRVKISKRNRAENLKSFSKIKSSLRAFSKEKDIKKKEKLLNKTYSIIDRAAKKNLLHKNKAARIKSRLQKSLSQKGKKNTKKK
jgi:small subunit ribosomal protein S20